MQTLPFETATDAIAPTRDRRRELAAGWMISHHDRVTSTQALAKDLPAWSVVWADEQSCGRGQAERSFVSDPGGIYLTAVLPYNGDAVAMKGFALAIGWGVCAVLRRAGITHARLRWPNDLMVGRVKVGGILVDQGGPRTLLVGVGLNVTNRPWVFDSALGGIAGRLADACDGRELPGREEWVTRVLRAIALAHREFGRIHLTGFVRVLSRYWGESRQVALEPARGKELTATNGWFLGIDQEGAVRLRTAPGVEAHVPAHHIQRLREVV
jgi:BirA family biotin operon repressor/biotin-[acetyl-CoA-carboxylase] ligase